MYACEEYARRWAMKEDVEVDALSEWVKASAHSFERFTSQPKELPRVDRTRNPVGDDKIKTLVTWWY